MSVLLFHLILLGPACDKERMMIFIQVRINTAAPKYNGFSSVDEVTLLLELAVNCKGQNDLLAKKILKSCLLRYQCLKSTGLVCDAYDKLFESSSHKNIFVETGKLMNKHVNQSFHEL